jgi:biopolymer transport protein ExbD
VLKRPSSRRNSHQGGIEINLVPILDTMVTLIGFLLFTTSFLAIVSIESPIPQASTEEVQEQLKEKPLQLTITVKEKEIEIWSPFNKITAKTIPNTPDSKPDIKAMHEALLEIKKNFITETTVVIVPTKTSQYDTLIALMDSARTIEVSDPPMYAKNEKTGNDEPVKALFPKIVFGNLLEN